MRIDGLFQSLLTCLRRYGIRVWPDGTILYTPFPDYEVEDPLTGANTVRTTYRFAGQIVAMQTRTGTAEGEYYYTYSDHLGNVAALSSKAGAFTTDSLARYDPFGNYRTTPSTAVNPAITNHGFTGHRHNNTGIYPTQNLGLIYMNARYYMPEIGRFISPDSIVPDPSNPQDFNRYSYVRNSPMNFTDPTGHREIGANENDLLPYQPEQSSPSSDSLQDLIVTTPRVTEAFPLPSDSDLTQWLVTVLVAYANSDQINSMAATWWLGQMYGRFPLWRVNGMLLMGDVLQEWTRHVWTDAVWDFKPDILGKPEILINGFAIKLGNIDELSYEAVANIFYGFIGRQIGMGEMLLQAGAGAAQARWGFEHWYGNLSDFPPGFGDQAFDAWSIQFGYHLHDQFGSNLNALTVSSFSSSLDSYLAMFPMPAMP